MPDLKDFDRFLSEREEKMISLKVFGREMSVPAELPFDYMLKVDRLIQNGTPIPGEENLRLLQRLLNDEDYIFILRHPDFRASYIWEIIAFTWLLGEEDPDAPKFTDEDQEGARAAKNPQSARQS